MAFMEPEILHGEWYAVETSNGTEFVPCEVGDIGLYVGISTDEPETVAMLRDYCEAEPQSVKMISGWGARLSAPGYLDCTPWSVFETEQEALDYLRDETETDEDEDEDETDS